MITGKLRRFVNQFLLEKPGRSRTLEQWIQVLIESGERLRARAAAAEDTPANRARLNHITGIERWTQRRLRVFLGQLPVRDEYDGYRPGENLNWHDQMAAFTKARSETVALLRKLAAAEQSTLPPVVEHNQLGPLSLYAWIRYIHMHAGWEFRRIR